MNKILKAVGLVLGAVGAVVVGNTVSNIIDEKVLGCGCDCGCELDELVDPSEAPEETEAE